MIDTQAIRTRILHLALQGKLVPQSSSDDSAIDLVSALCKIIKGQSFQNNISQQEIPYDIPDSWVWCHLSDIGTTNIGLTYHPEDVSANGTIVARSSNIVNNKMDYTDLVKVTCPIRDNQFLHTHDILICARNGSKALVGKCAIFEGTPKTVAFGAFMAVFRTPLYRFVYYYFNSQVFKRNFFNDESKQINQVTQSILKKSLIPIPPIQEQERITQKIEQAFSILDTIDELQAQYADNLSALKSKLIDAAIQGKLTEQLPADGTAEEYLKGIEKEKIEIESSGVLKGRKKKKVLSLLNVNFPFEIPSSWKWIRLNSVAEIFGRIGFRGYTKNDIVEQGKGAISLSPSNITKSGKITYESCTYLSWNKYNESPEIMVENEDVILVKTGSSYGKCAIVKSLPEKATINPQLAILKYVLCDRNYLHIVLISELAHKQYEEFVIGAATPTFSQENLANFLLPLPPLAEQKRIVQKLDEILPLCERIN